MRLISSNTWFLEIIQGLTVTESLQQGVLHPMEYSSYPIDSSFQVLLY